MGIHFKTQDTTNFLFKNRFLKDRDLRSEIRFAII